MKALWDEVQATVKENIPEHSYNMWIKPIQYQKVENDNIIVSCSNFYSKKRILEQYEVLFNDKIKLLFGKAYKIKIEVADFSQYKLKNTPSVKQVSFSDDNLRVHSGRYLKKSFTFDEFVVGNNNEFAFSAALSLASCTNNYQNFLYLISKPGMGKSHLSQAVGNYLLSGDSSCRIYYITAEDFTNEMIQSFKNNTFNVFKTKYSEGCDVLLLENVQYLSGKERTQEELASTLDYLQEAEKKIIFSSYYLPVDIPKLNNKLRSRLTSALISNIDAPDYRMRVKILQKKCECYGYSVNDDVIHYLASELTEDIRQLESGLKGAVTKSSLLGVPIDFNLVESIVKNMIQVRKTITISTIKKLVSKQFNVTVNDLVSRSRKQNIVRPRNIAMYLARNYTDSPLQVIGKAFNRYHATVLHSIGKIESGIKKDITIKKQIEIVSRKIEDGVTV